MIKKILQIILIGMMILPEFLQPMEALAIVEDIHLELDIVEEEMVFQEQPLPQSKASRGLVYLEAGKILNFGTGTYLYDFDMNAVSISYQGNTSLALIQELYLNGLRVYCIEPEVLTADGAGYQMGVANSLISREEQRVLGLTSYFGYGYQGDTSDAMSAATIVAVWIARGRIISDVSDEVMEKVRLIQNRVAKVDVRPSFESEQLRLKGYGKEHAITLHDQNQVLEEYDIYQDGGYSIEKIGNTLQVWLEKGVTPNGKIVFDRIQRSSQGNQVIYVNPDGKQTLMSIVVQNSESVEFQPSIVKGGLRITKQNEDGVIVPNTTFKLSYHADMSNAIGIFTTNGFGYVDIPQLEPMDVYVQEISVPAPYVNDQAIEKVTIKGGETMFFRKVNRYKKGNAKIVKKDSASGNTIYVAGTQFDIFTFQHQFVERVTTDGTGIAVSGDLRYGSYYFKEVLAPNGYVLNSTIYPFDITEDNVIVEKECYDTRVRARISIRKEDQMSGTIAQGDATLEGAVYGLYADEAILSPDNHHIVYSKDTLITKKPIENGMLAFDELLLGKYYVKELVASDGYTLDPNKYPIDCSYESQYVEIVQKQQTVLERVKSQSFQIIKVSTDGTTGEIPALANAEFTIKLKRDVDTYGWENAPIAKNANDVEASKLVTDATGYAKSEELPYGTYIVRETLAPVGTTPVKDFEVKITEDNRTPQVWRIFNDAPIQAHIKVIKVDEETGKVIATPFVKFKIRNIDTNEYVKFWIKYPTPTLLDTFETDETGTFTTPSGLPYGRYQLEEIKAPNGYILDDKPLIFEINDHSAYETMENGTDVQIVLKKPNKQVKGKIQIDKKAKIFSHFDFQSTEFGKVFQPIFEEGYLDEVTFDIYAKEDIKTLDGTIWYRANEKVETVTTTKDHPAVSKELPLGTYVVKEVSTKEGYIINPIEYEVTLSYENQTVPIVSEVISVMNKKEQAKLKFKKEFEETPFQTAQEASKQTKFGVFLKEPLKINGDAYLQKDDLLGIVSLNERGEGNILLDFAGEYYLKEIQSDSSYVLDEQQYPFTFEYKNNDHEIVMEKPIVNKSKKGNLKILKMNEVGKPLSGVTFELSLTNDFKDILSEKNSDEFGEIHFENLAYGTYYLRESKTGALYILDDEVKEIVIEEEEKSIEVTNRIRKSSIQIKKIDEQHSVLQGVEFSLYDESNTFMESKITDDNGIVLFEGLKNGKYFVKETKPLNGYQTLTGTIEVIVEGNDEGKVYEYEVLNTKIVETGIEDNYILHQCLFAVSFILVIMIGIRKKRLSKSIVKTNLRG